MFKHFYDYHHDSELKKWGISRDRIGEALKEECGIKSIKTAEPIEGILQDRNAYGLCPVSG